jgi:hypothetical protein
MMGIHGMIQISMTTRNRPKIRMQGNANDALAVRSV